MEVKGQGSSDERVLQRIRHALPGWEGERPLKPLEVRNTKPERLPPQTGRMRLSSARAVTLSMRSLAQPVAQLHISPGGLFYTAYAAASDAIPQAGSSSNRGSLAELAKLEMGRVGLRYTGLTGETGKRGSCRAVAGQSER